MSITPSEVLHSFLRSVHLWIYLLKWPIAFVAGWAGIHYQRWRKQRAEAVAEGWPSVTGRISDGTFKPIPKTKRVLATLTYTYFVGEYRFGKYIHEFESESDAGDFIRAMKDKQVPIRYNSSNPDKSVLEQRAVEQYVLLAPRFS